MSRKTAVQTEGDKQGLIDGVPVRKSPLVAPHPPSGVWTQENFSKSSWTSRLKGGCGQDWPPHTL